MFYHLGLEERKAYVLTGKTENCKEGNCKSYVAANPPYVFDFVSTVVITKYKLPTNRSDISFYVTTSRHQ